jgi:hypothetical protein
MIPSHNSEEMIESPIAVHFTRNTEAENSFGITSMADSISLPGGIGMEWSINGKG